MQRSLIIGSCPLFSGLGEDNIRTLDLSCRERRVDKKSFIFLEEDPGSSMFILGEGLVQLYKTSEDGSETVIRIVRPGEAFAEVVLFEQNRYPVTSIALQYSELLEIPKEAIHRLLEQKAFRDDFISALLRRQRYLAQRVHEMSALDVEERLLSFFRQHYGNQKRITTDLSKKEVASAIGATPETLSRLLLRLEESGKLKWQGKLVMIGDE